MARKRADFEGISMASRINSRDSNDLNSNCIIIDPRTGEKFSFNVDIVAATAWQHPHKYTFIHARSFMHFIQWETFLFFVLYITSLSTNEIGRYLTYLKYPPERKSSARCPILLTMTTFWVPVCISYSDVIYTHALLTYCEASRKACGLSELRWLSYSVPEMAQRVFMKNIPTSTIMTL